MNDRVKNAFLNHPIYRNGQAIDRALRRVFIASAVRKMNDLDAVKKQINLKNSKQK